MRHLILGSVILAAAASSQAFADTSVDLSHYSCAGLETAEVRVTAQVVGGVLTEWRGFTATENGVRHLKCIAVARPDARTLTADEAKAFLAKIGAGAQRAATTGPAKAPAAAQSTPGANVRPEPLKAKPASVGTVSRTAPLPAARDFAVAPATTPTAATATAALAAAPLAAAATTTTTTVSSTARTRVPTPLVQPWRSIGELDATFPNGETVRCTGTLISEYAVLTAGACVHNAARGGYATAVSFYPGQYDAGGGTQVRPYGAKSDVASLRTTQRWTEISGNTNLTGADHAYNMGAVMFRTPYRPPVTDDWGGIGILGLSTPQSQWGGGPADFTGYPGSVDGKTSYGQYQGSGAETEDGRLKYRNITHTEEYALPTAPGDMGAPIYGLDTMFHTADIDGLVTYADATGTVAGGPMIEYGWNRDLVLGWAGWTPPGSPPPTEAVSEDLRVASIFSTSQPTSQSYLRFHNVGGAPGHVTVDLKNPTTGETVASWTSTDIQAGGELQVFIQDIERNATGVKPPNYALSVRPTFEGYFQHVLWQRADNTLTNLTSCDSGAMNDPKTLVAVHSSLLQAAYPSTVVVYNSGAAAADISLGILDARNGSRLGTYHVGVVQPGAQAVTNVPAMEKAARITPSGTMYHYVVTADTAFSGYLQHIVQNTGDGVLTDMSIVCKLTPPQS